MNGDCFRKKSENTVNVVFDSELNPLAQNVHFRSFWEVFHKFFGAGTFPMNKMHMKIIENQITRRFMALNVSEINRNLTENYKKDTQVQDLKG